MFGVKMLGVQKFASDAEVQICNQSFFSGIDSSRHRSSHPTFKSLLTDKRNV